MIVRVSKRETPFVVIDKTGLQDPKLSFKAKGLLAYLLSLPDDWSVNIRDLANRSTDGRASVAAGLQELLENGYAIHHQKRSTDGKWEAGSWQIFEIPHDSDVSTVARFSGHGESAILNTQPTETDKNMSDPADADVDVEAGTAEKPDSNNSRNSDYPEWFEELWSVYPKMVKGRTNPKRGTYLKAKGWLKKGYTEQELIDAVKRYRASKPNPQYVWMGQTFFGPAGHFEGFLEGVVDNGNGRSDTSTLPKLADRRVIQPESLIDMELF